MQVCKCLFWAVSSSLSLSFVGGDGFLGERASEAFILAKRTAGSDGVDVSHSGVEATSISAACHHTPEANPKAS